MNQRELFDFLLGEPAGQACAAPDPVHIVYGESELILCRTCHWTLYEPPYRPSELRHNVPCPPLAALDLLAATPE